MSATCDIVGDDVRAQFRAPWTITDHALFLKTKALPEARCEYRWQDDSYTLSAPARFAHVLGVERPARETAPLPLADYLFPYQKWIVDKALAAKRYAIWADCGLGKTPMQLEWARHVAHRTGGKVLILAPPAVCHQTVEEAVKFYPAGEVRPEFFATRTLLEYWLKQGDAPIGITNYEKFIPGVCDDVRRVAGLVCDESSILKGGGGVIKWNLIKSARGIGYKLSCTATPAPNDTMEYASQASFLEKLRTEGEILWTFFHRDAKSQVWRVKPHAKEAFFRFMSSWSIYLRKPSAYGFHDPFADVPEPEIIPLKIEATAEQAAAAREYLRSYDPTALIPKERLGMRSRAKLSQLAKGFFYAGAGNERRVRRVTSDKPEIVAGLVCEAIREKRQALVWTVFDEESDILAELLRDVPEVSTLHGRDSEEARTEKLDAFRHGEIRVLISKAALLGYGLNFQFCTRMIFSGFDDSFERFYQAVRRCYRYGSREQLKVYVPYVPSLEDQVWENVLRKKGQWESDAAEQEARYREALSE